MKQLIFGHFNTRSKNFTVTVIFFPRIKQKRPPKGQFVTYTSPKMHLACPPKFCICIVFNFSRDGCNTKEKWKPTVTQFFFGGGGWGGQTRCIMGYKQMANITLFSISRSFRPFYADNPDYFRRFSKIPEDCRRFPKATEDVRRTLQTLNRIFSRNKKPHSDLQNPTHESKKY